jgi:8-oxo-dGTP pyrophosphatase MutT (NUDIX family)
MSHIRPLAICVFRHSNKILVFEGIDPATDETFYRPLGGGIEFGEYSTDTVRRELREEIGAEVRDLVYLGTLENIFTYDGEPGHEIVQVYDGALTEPGLYEQAVIVGREADVEDKYILYPDGLLEMLSG